MISSDSTVANEIKALGDIDTLGAYFDSFGPLLGQKAVSALDPLYVPGVTPSIDMGIFGRAPFPCQANVINAAALAWQRTRSLILCGEMGTGKTLLGAAAIHAAMVARKSGSYRVLIMAPNHLIDKWEREIMKTIPGARVITFNRSNGTGVKDANGVMIEARGGDDSYKGVLQYVRARRSETQEGRWITPDCHEWVIVGRNQAKWDPSWKTIAEVADGAHPGSIKTIVVAWDDKVDPATGRKIYNKRSFQPVKVAITAEAVVCPRCGQPARTSSGLIMTAENLATKDTTTFCRARYLQEVQPADPAIKRPAEGYDRIVPVEGSKDTGKYWDYVARAEIDNRGKGKTTTIGDRTYQVRECGEALWNWTPQPRKWAPARIIQKKARNLFDYFILDEMHEEKAAESAQALAAGKLMAASKRLIALTGTLIGGYASHLFPMLMRMAPRTLIEEGFKWKGEKKFSEVYGRIDKTITRKFGEEPVRSSKARRSTSMRKGDGTPTIREDVKPGVMPSFFGRHLMDKAIFIGLDEMYEDLPSLMDDDRSLIPVEMDADLAASYRLTQNQLVAANNALLLKGNLKLMSTLLHTLLGYPNRPFGWVAPPGVHKDAKTVGWWMDAKDKKPHNYVGVSSPDNLSEERVYAKEQALIDLVYREATEGRQVWIYVEMTGKRDIQSRLAGLLRDRGFKGKVLRTGSCQPRDREAWIAKNAPGQHFIISNPDLVSTGLDFFDSDNFTYNFPTIIFYQPTYDLNAMRQAGRRHWRIGQPEDCRTFYLYYTDTMEHRAVKHVGDKLAAAKSLEGKFSAEGLAALASGGLAMTAMAKSLSAKIDDPRAAWSKLRGATKAKVARLAKEHLLDGLALVANTVPGRRDEAKLIAEAIVLTPDEDALLDDLDPDTIDLDDESITRFQKAMADLGLSLEDLEDMDIE